MTLLLFFGFLHQSGVTRSLQYFQSRDYDIHSKVSLIYFETYMPPGHLLADREGRFVLEDFNDHSALHEYMRSSALKGSDVIVCHPATVDIEVPTSSYYGRAGEVVFSFHISTENLPNRLNKIMEQMSLVCSFYDSKMKYA